jgi:hypothetical protein
VCLMGGGLVVGLTLLERYRGWFGVLAAPGGNGIPCCHCHTGITVRAVINGW